MADVRSYQLAVVADSVLNPLDGDRSALRVLEEERFGLVQLPPDDLDAEVATAWLDQVIEHVLEFTRNGYAVVLVDEGHEGALRELDLPTLSAKSGEEVLRGFLRRHAFRPPA